MGQPTGLRAFTPCCPRCDYDQSGEITRWTDACPLDGTCTECGLRFDWADVLVLSRRELPWMYEHKKPWRPSLRRAVSTGLHLLFPWRFWRQVKMSHRVSAWRAWWWLGLIALVLWLPGAGLGVLRYAYAYSQTQWRSTVSWETYVPVLTHDFVQVGSGTDGLVLVSAQIGRFAWHLVIPPMPFGVYFLVGFSLSMPLLLCTLGRTRHLRGVRTAHLIRASVYGSAWVGLLLLFGVVEHGIHLAYLVLWPGTSAGWEAASGLYALLWPAGWLVLAWVMLWWWYAIVRGWQLPRAGLVWIVLCVPCALAGLVVVAIGGQLGWLTRWLGIF